MGNVHYVTKTNEFWIKNLNDFKEGLKGYVGGEHDSPVRFSYSDYKRRSKKALIDLNSEDFSVDIYPRDDYHKSMNFLEYIQQHLVEEEQAVIHLVAYEHAGDMCIYKYIVTPESIQSSTILD